MKSKSKKSRLPKELTTITTTSRIVALCLFFVLPILGFLVGIRYQKTLTELNYMTQPVAGPEVPLSPLPNVVACTEEAMMCPDGSYVARISPACQFALCPKN